jgi:hypothetical protein
MSWFLKVLARKFKVKFKKVNNSSILFVHSSIVCIKLTKKALTLCTIKVILPKKNTHEHHVKSSKYIVDRR